MCPLPQIIYFFEIHVGHIRELSFLMLGTGVGEFLEGYQIFRSCCIGVSHILEEIVKYLMGCENFGIYFGLK